MELLDQLNSAIQYIEDNIEDDDALALVAKKTEFSMYHFQRLFNYLTDMSLSEYIRKRKLSRAVTELQEGERILDVAVKYGYTSADSFSRAFEKQHGKLPSEVRKQGETYNIFTPLTFKIGIIGGQQMKCKTIKKPAFQMFGISSKPLYSDFERAFDEVSKFWEEFEKQGYRASINEFLNLDPCELLHGALYDYTDTTFRYMLCQFVPESVKIPEEYDVLNVEEATWMVFEGDYGNTSKVWKQIYTEWLPTSNYRIVSDLYFEMYYGNTKEEKFSVEIWLPVETKNR
jgi:AraC family transcriptional regulator